MSKVFKKQAAISDIDRQMIYKLMYVRDLQEFDEYGIDSSIYDPKVDGRAHQALKAIEKHRREFGSLIPLESLENKIATLRPTIPESELKDQPLKWFCNQVHARLAHNIIYDSMQEAEEKLAVYDNEEAKHILNSALRKIENRHEVTTDSDIGERTEERKKRYLEGKSGEGHKGIPTGFDAMDYITGGVMPTDLWTIVGYTSAGKSQTLVKIGTAISKAGMFPILVTKEMSPSQLQRRVDAFAAEVSLSRLNKFALSPVEEEKYFNFLDGVKESGQKLKIIESTGGIGQLAAIIEKYKPDILLVDGPYLMAEDSRGNQANWERIDQVWIDMKNICLAYKVPNISTMQLTENSASLGKIAMAKGLARHCDSIWGMEQTDEMRDGKEIKFVSLKQREAENIGDFTIGWDFVEMDFDLRKHRIPGFDSYLINKNSTMIKKPEAAEGANKKALLFNKNRKQK